MQWVAAENAKTLPKLESDPRYPQFYKDAYAIAAAEDRIPFPDQKYGRVFNFWRDGAHPARHLALDDRGQLQHSPAEVDDGPRHRFAGQGGGKNWVWKGSNCLEPEERLCLLNLSDGGAGWDHGPGVRPGHGAVRLRRVRAAPVEAGCDLDQCRYGAGVVRLGRGHDDGVGLSVRDQAARAGTARGPGGRGIPRRRIGPGGRGILHAARRAGSQAADDPAGAPRSSVTRPSRCCRRAR